MFNSARISRYYPRESFLHSLDPRAKLLSLIFLLTAILLLNSWPALLLLTLGTAVLAALSAIPFKVLLQGLRPMLFILLFTFVINIFVPRGDHFWLIGPLKIYQASVSTAFFVALRVILLIFTSNLLLTLTTPAMKLCDAIESLLRPCQRLGLPVHDLAMMMSIALRFVPTLLEEMDKIMKAQSSRGANFDSGGLWRRMVGYSSILVPLFLSSLRRAEDLAEAMEARAYRGGEGRTRLHPLRWTAKDLLFMFLLLAILLAMIIVERLLF